MPDEYIMELGKALYDTGAAVFKPEFRGRLTRCGECAKHHTEKCPLRTYWHGENGYCSLAERKQDGK